MTQDSTAALLNFRYNCSEFFYTLCGLYFGLFICLQSPLFSVFSPYSFIFF